MAVAIRAKRKWGQVVENKQFCEMARFAPSMISTTYDAARETARFARRKEAFNFAGFPPRRGPKRKGAKSTADSGRARRKWRRKPLESLKTDS
jgi:hypothetical protein